MPERFLQIHTLTSYPASLLNRDDAGFAKRIRFGGAERIRISSQCLKRHWRRHEGEHSLRTLGVPETLRSRRTFHLHVVRPLVEQGVPEDVALAVTEALTAAVLGDSAKAKERRKSAKKEGEDQPIDARELRTEQVTVLGRPEVDYLLGVARQACDGVSDPKKAAASVKDLLGRDGRANLKALGNAMGLDAALFGRMVTGDVLARGDAAIHVAHAFTVHEGQPETDYFSAMDDLLDRGDDEGDTQLGSGHIGTAELAAGLFHGYAVVDVPLLVSNLTGCEAGDWTSADRGLAGEVVSRLVHLMATVSPGAKRGSTAPYSYAHLVLAESGSAQPRTLANAFLDAVPEGAGLVQRTYAALARHVAELDRAYGRREERRLAGLGPVEGLCDATGAGTPASVDDLARWVAERVASAS
jgi:CRISPR system Cascade subunit CasC